MKGFIQCSHWSDTTAGRKDAIGSHSGIFCQLMCSNSKLEEKKKKITFSVLSVCTNLKSDSLHHSHHQMLLTNSPRKSLL